MTGSNNLEFAATTIGIMLTMLREKGHSDNEIMGMLGKAKVKAILNVLKGRSQAAQYLQTVEPGIIINTKA